MEKGKSLSVGLLVKPAEGHRQGMIHEENGRLHGVDYSTSKYAQRWCEKMRRTAETYLKTQSPVYPSGAVTAATGGGEQRRLRLMAYRRRQRDLLANRAVKPATGVKRKLSVVEMLRQQQVQLTPSGSGAVLRPDCRVADGEAGAT